MPRIRFRFVNYNSFILLLYPGVIIPIAVMLLFPSGSASENIELPNGLQETYSGEVVGRKHTTGSAENMPRKGVSRKHNQRGSERKGHLQKTSI